MTEKTNNGWMEVCRDISSRLVGIVDWKWDERFELILGEFPSERKEDVQKVLDGIFIEKWGSSEIGKAPEYVKEIGRFFGGVFSGQYILISAEINQVRLFCAWWPWGNGLTISIRISVLSEAGNDDSYIAENLRNCFGIQG